MLEKQSNEFLLVYVVHRLPPRPWAANAASSAKPIVLALACRTGRQVLQRDCLFKLVISYAMANASAHAATSTVRPCASAFNAVACSREDSRVKKKYFDSLGKPSRARITLLMARRSYVSSAKNAGKYSSPDGAITKIDTLLSTRRLPGAACPLTSLQVPLSRIAPCFQCAVPEHVRNLIAFRP